MNKYWISFYLGICLLLSFLTVQSQSIAQFTFTSITNIAAAPVSVHPDPLTAITDSSLSLHEISGRAFTEIPFQIEHGYPDVAQGQSGILFMDNPANFNHPVPMRVWPGNQNAHRDVLFSFSPTRNNDWTILPGNNYTLKYRMFVYDGTISAAEAKKYGKLCNKPGIQHQKNK